jgi:hypothetical protein
MSAGIVQTKPSKSRKIEPRAFPRTLGKCCDVSWWATSRFNLIEELAVAAQHRVGFVMATKKGKFVVDMNFISPRRTVEDKLTNPPWPGFLYRAEVGRGEILITAYRLRTARG